MLSSRVSGLLVAASFLRLSLGGIAPACVTSAEGAVSHAPAAHAMSHAADESPDAPQSESPEQADVPVCCAAMAACSNSMTRATDAGLHASGRDRSDVLFASSAAPSSRIVAPEPPPPKA